MTAPATRIPAWWPLGSVPESAPCAACRVILPLPDLEPIPTQPWLVRCRDEASCRKRYTPRRLARSVRKDPL